MKLHFDSNLDYQLDAINAVVDVFQGQSYEGGSSEMLDVDEKQMSIEQVSARGNVLSLTKKRIVKNTMAVQERNDTIDAKKRRSQLLHRNGNWHRQDLCLPAHDS